MTRFFLRDLLLVLPLACLLAAASVLMGQAQRGGATLAYVERRNGTHLVDVDHGRHWRLNAADVFAGTNFGAAWSPRGTWFTVTQPRGSVSQYPVPLSFTVRGQQITFTLSEQIQSPLVWSPDERWVVVALWRDDQVDLAAIGRDCFVTPADCPDPLHIITPGTPGSERAPNWSDDGRYLAYFTRRDDGDYLHIAPGDCVAAGDCRGAAVHLPGLMLNLDDPPTVRPGDDRVVFSAVTPDGSALYALPLACLERVATCADHLTRLPTGQDRNFDPLWTPSGRWLLFTTAKQNTFRLMALDFVCVAAGDDCDVAQQITRHAPGALPSFSPDGRWLLTSHADLLVFALDCLAPGCERGQYALTDGLAADVQATWSPDGRLIAFTSDRARPNSGETDIYILPTACIERGCTNADIQRVTFNGRSSSPQWLPD